VPEGWREGKSVDEFRSQGEGVEKEGIGLGLATLLCLWHKEDM
jgi:hypothetical protein